MKPFISADIVKAQIAGLLTQHPQLREDDEALVLSLESETDAVSLCEKLVRAAKEAEVRSDAIGKYVADLRARADLLDIRSERLRDTLLKIMDAAGIKSLPLAAATLSIRYTPHVNVIERELVPEYYRRQPPWEPHKNLIGAALKAGQHVPGCTLSNPEPSLSIRVK